MTMNFDDCTIQLQFNCKTNFTAESSGIYTFQKTSLAEALPQIYISLTTVQN